MQSVPSEADAFYNNLISRISSSNFCSYSVHVGCDCNVEGEVIDGCAEGRRRNTFRETLPTTYHNITSTTTSATNLRRCRKNNILHSAISSSTSNKSPRQLNNLRSRLQKNQPRFQSVLFNLIPQNGRNTTHHKRWREAFCILTVTK